LNTITPMAVTSYGELGLRAVHAVDSVRSLVIADSIADYTSTKMFQHQHPLSVATSRCCESVAPSRYGLSRLYSSLGRPSACVISIAPVDSDGGGSGATWVRLVCSREGEADGDDGGDDVGTILVDGDSGDDDVGCGSRRRPRR
jgi:hypothetical protein